MTFEAILYQCYHSVEWPPVIGILESMETKGTLVISGLRSTHFNPMFHFYTPWKRKLGLNGLILGKDSCEQGRKYNYTLYLIRKGPIIIVSLINIISRAKLALFLSRRMTTWRYQKTTCVTNFFNKELWWNLMWVSFVSVNVTVQFFLSCYLACNAQRVLQGFYNNFSWQIQL